MNSEINIKNKIKKIQEANELAFEGGSDLFTTNRHQIPTNNTGFVHTILRQYFYRVSNNLSQSKLLNSVFVLSDRAMSIGQPVGKIQGPDFVIRMADGTGFHSKVRQWNN